MLTARFLRNLGGVKATCLGARGGMWEGSERKVYRRDVSRFYSLGEYEKVDSWVKEMKDLCKPEKVHVCDGSLEEYQGLIDLMVEKGTLSPLSRNGSYIARSDARDVARVEKNTYICSQNEIDAGPTNNWISPSEMRGTLKEKFVGCMEGRTMYVIPFSMGPLSSPLSKIGIQVSDSPYVAANMRIMARIGKPVLDILGTNDFIPCVHSVGAPLPPSAPSSSDVPWPCNDEKYIVHFPETREIWSYGSGYGGNALLGKKCLALRIASILGRDEGWMAEHMLIMAVTSPEGETKYMAAAFPSACGKTNLALMAPLLPGWKVEVVGDDIAWMRIGKDGQLYAINPENGFFGVAPGTSPHTNPNGVQTIAEDTLFTNVAVDPKTNDVWWEGLSSPPEELIDWKGNTWKNGETKTPASHPNARFTAKISNCPNHHPAFDDPHGVPISAIIFGGRRATTVPLVTQAKSWQHGTFMGVGVASEQTAAAEGQVGQLRHDPFAMIPFCGYNMADYFSHWLEMGEKGEKEGNLPKIFCVNWFRKDSEGNFIWPGFGENIRVLEWIFNRADEDVKETNIAQDTPIGFLPKKDSINIDGLGLTEKDMKLLFDIDQKGWNSHLDSLENFLAQFGDRVPEGIQKELTQLRSSLQKQE